MGPSIEWVRFKPLVARDGGREHVGDGALCFAGLCAGSCDRCRKLRKRRRQNLRRRRRNRSRSNRSNAKADAAALAGNNAWMLTSSALVLFMTAPGLAMFYGGLVRKKNVLSVIMQCLFLMGLMTVIWATLRLLARVRRHATAVNPTSATATTCS